MPAARTLLKTLPPEEWARVVEARESTLRLVLVDGVPVDEFAAAAARCYAEIGQPAPAVLVAPSPFAAILWAALLKRGQLDGQLDGQLVGQLVGQLDGLAKLMRDVYRDARHLGWWRISYLTHWLHVATIPGIRHNLNKIIEALTAYRTFCTTFTIPLTGVVIGVGPHFPIQRDRDGRLHCTTGPAWAWPDGYAVWALNGIVVPEWAVMAPDAKRIITELANTEQRRVALTHLGWDRAVVDLELEVIDTHDNPHIGTLYRLPKEVTGSRSRASLLVCRNASPERDGTWRTYGLLAAPTCRTAIEAQASLAALPVEDWLALDGAS